MVVSHLSKIVTVGAVLLVAGCASAPRSINDVCSVFDQRDGWFENWERASTRASRTYGVPVPILMATVRKESGFKPNARPPRKYYLGFIPGARASTAYGYSQALDGTWAEYVTETRKFGARRSNFADAVDFVGWYHAKSADTLGIGKADAYNLYLAYYYGRAGYARGQHRSDPRMQRYARDTADMAERYAQQMAACGRGR